MNLASDIFIIASTDDYQLDEQVILTDPSTGLPLGGWLRDATVRNKAVVFFDFNVPGMVKDGFGARQLYTADRSVERHLAQELIEGEFRGVRSALGGQTLLDQWAVRYFQRWGYPPPLLRLSTVYLKHPLELLDSVRVTHSKIKNPITGLLGLTRERFEVLDVTPHFLTDGRLDLLLLWTGAIEASPAPIGVSSGLIPATTTLDDTDAAVPLGGNVQRTTAPNTKTFRIGLKGSRWRWWSGQQRIYADRDFSQEKFPSHCAQMIHSECGDPVNRYNNWVYNAVVGYAVDYKTANAPNVTGTGDDPTTGWIEILNTTRGNTAVFASNTCKTAPTQPATPAEDVWTALSYTPERGPDTYAIRVRHLSHTHAGAPGAGTDCTNTHTETPFNLLTGDAAGCGHCPREFLGNTNQEERSELTLDFLESQT